MSSIQEIHELEQRLYDIVQAYVNGDYNENDVLAIGYRHGEITLKVDNRNALKIGKNTEVYQLKNLVRTSDDGEPEPDNDSISDIANSWLFL